MGLPQLIVLTSQGIKSKTRWIAFTYPLNTPNMQA